MDLSFLPETNWVDLIVLTFLIRGGYIGLSRGFSVELLKIFGAVATAVLSLLCYQKLGQWLSTHSFLSPHVADFLSFLAIAFLLMFIFRVLRILLLKIMHLELFYGWEKWGGLILGLACSVVFASLSLFLLTILPVNYLQESVMKKSFSGPYLIKVAPQVKDFIIKFKPKSEEEDDAQRNL